nr:transposase [Desulfuromonadales bacterium]
MMGEPVGRQDRLFYEFNLDEVVPPDHLLRKIDAVLDLSWLREELVPHYSSMGRPSVDPELMIRMLLVGYCYSIRSERRLCQEVELNLAYRWFCRLGLEDRVPDHSTFSVNRHGRFRDSDLLRRVFEEVVCGCMTAGLVGGEGFAVDASVIEADASRYQRVEGAEIAWTPEQRSRRAIKEYVDALESEASPLNPRQKPKAMSPTDPCAAWTTRGRHKVMFGYSLNYLIDMDNAVILDVEATPTRITKEVDATETMIARVEDRFALKPRHVAGDVAYGTGEMLGWLVDREIDPHIPVWDKSERRDGIFSRADFTYDEDRDVYICPGGKLLKTTGTVHVGQTLYYRARKSDCQSCPLKARCCPKTPERRISRDVNQKARDYTQTLMQTEAYGISSIERKKVETLFGEAKRILSLTRLRLRGLSGARDEFLLTATVQNLKRLAKLAAIPPPTPVMA